LLLLFSLWTFPPLAYTEAGIGSAAHATPLTALLKLVEWVQSGSEFDQVDFAWVAIAEMVDAYEREAELSGQGPASDPGTRKKLRRWRSATLGYAQHLRRQLEAIQQGASVSVHLQEPSTLVVITGGQATVINGPQAIDNGQLARQILLNYCSVHLCPEPALSEAEEPPEPTEMVSGQWSYGQDLAARYETPDGLIFEFGYLGSRQDAQQGCERLVADLRALARRLRPLHQAGTPVAWDRLRILSAGGADSHRVLLNDAGRSIRLSLPNLYLVQELLREASPWLEAQADGRTEAQVIPQAERYTSSLPPPLPAEETAYQATRRGDDEPDRPYDY